MKQKKFILTIKNPCEEEWSSMTKTNIGKFCSQCSKTVVDFTQLTDNEIIKIIEQRSDKLCGRLTKQQLDRFLESNQPMNNSRLYKILTALLVIGATKNSFAIDRIPSQIEIVSITKNKNLTTERIETQKEPTTDSLNVIQGKVFDSHTKEPLPFASILIKGARIGVMTDSNGNFKLIIPDSLLTEKIHLIVVTIGYEKTEITINRKDLPITQEFLIIPAERVLMGDVIIIKKKKWWQFWKRK